ncbi:MAG: hypothetical protein ACOYOA_06880 [Saprospiraceae bacterium]
MKKNKILLPVFVCLVFAIPAFAQLNASLRANDLKPLLGIWRGNLTYLDYSSNKPYSMPADIKISQIGKSSNFILFNTYPDEPQANSTDTIIISKGGTMISKESVISVHRKVKGTIEFTNEIQGEDGNDNKAALIRHIYKAYKKNFSIRKEVQFKGEQKWILRNEYKYEKK